MAKKKQGEATGQVDYFSTVVRLTFPRANGGAFEFVQNHLALTSPADIEELESLDQYGKMFWRVDGETVPKKKTKYVEGGATTGSLDGAESKPDGMEAGE